MENISKVSEKYKDPVCDMDVDPGEKGLVSMFNGKSYWFCSQGCRRSFEDNPVKYLKSDSPKRKGRFRRYLDKMAEANEREFGRSGPKCH
jgi:YHS domain-containing protein